MRYRAIGRSTTIEESGPPGPTRLLTFHCTMHFAALLGPYNSWLTTLSYKNIYTFFVCLRISGMVDTNKYAKRLMAFVVASTAPRIPYEEFAPFFVCVVPPSSSFIIIIIISYPTWVFCCRVHMN